MWRLPLRAVVCCVLFSAGIPVFMEGALAASTAPSYRLHATTSSTVRAWKVEEVGSEEALAPTPNCFSVNLCIGFSSTTDGRGSIINGSTNGGKASHKLLEINGTSTDTNHLVGVTCSKAVTTCIAVGNATGTLNGHSVAGPFVVVGNVNTQSHWRTVALPTYSSVPLTEQIVKAVSCPSANECVAVGEMGTGSSLAWSTDNGGTTWQAIPSLPTNQYSDPSSLTAVACASATECIAAGSNAILYTDTGPTHFRGARTPKAWIVGQQGTNRYGGSTVPNIASIACATGSGACVAVGDLAQNNSKGNQVSYSALVATSAGGAVWASATSVPAPTRTFLVLVSCPAANTCVAGGSAEPPSGKTVGSKPVVIETGTSLRTWHDISLPNVTYGVSPEATISCGTPQFCITPVFATATRLFVLTGPA